MRTATDPGVAVAFSLSSLWIHHKLGFVPTAVLMLLACVCGGQIGSAMYRLGRACMRPRPNAVGGFKSMP